VNESVCEAGRYRALDDGNRASLVVPGGVDRLGPEAHVDHAAGSIGGRRWCACGPVAFSGMTPTEFAERMGQEEQAIFHNG
jgi:hypothetical protein